MKAINACGHKMLRIIYKILQSHQPYNSQKALGLRQQTNALSLGSSTNSVGGSNLTPN